MRKPNFKEIARWAILSVALSASAVGKAQVTVQKNGVDVPEAKVNILYNTTFRVVAREFHLPDSSTLHFPVTLVLGEPNERVSGDELNKVYVIYMESWDDAKFALAASRIAMQQLISEARKTRIVNEIVWRANQIVPVSLQASH
jgi:hypothetical protein